MTSVNDLITKVKTSSYTCSKSWDEMTMNLEHYLINGDLNLYKVHNISPQVFTWPEDGAQTKIQLEILERNTDTVLYKTLRINDYGPAGIRLYKNIQLDRVQQVWSIYKLINILKLNLSDDEIIFEFGGGTGQMADVLKDINFMGKHIVYDLPLMTVLQKSFIDKKGITNSYILDNEQMNIINGTNYLPCNQIKSEQHVLGLPNINFIATYSLTETDQDTRNKFFDYMTNFSRIYIVYWPGSTAVGDDIDNSVYIEKIKTNIKNTHYCYDMDELDNGKIFMAVKKDVMKIESTKIDPEELFSSWISLQIKV
jgi:hypothetical protein